MQLDVSEIKMNIDENNISGTRRNKKYSTFRESK